LSARDKLKFRCLIVFQSALGILDLFGVFLVGVIGALAINGIQSENPGNRTTSLLNFLKIDGLSPQHQVTILGAVAIVLFVTKTFLSLYLNKKSLKFLSHRAATLSTDLLSKVLAFRNKPDFDDISTQELQYSLGSGVTTMVIGVAGVSATIYSDLSLLFLLLLGLLLVDPLVAASSFLLFSTIGMFLYLYTQRKIHALGVELSELNIKSQDAIQNISASYKELFVQNRLANFVWEIKQLKTRFADVLALQSYLPNVSKYLMEASLIVATAILAFIQFSLRDAVHASASIAIFLAAGSRLAPAVLRLQQSAIQLKANLGIASSTQDLIQRYQNVIGLVAIPASRKAMISSEAADVTFDNVYFTYPNREFPAVAKLDLAIKQAQFVAIVGPSGAGKSTLIDLLIGIRDPSVGNITISGLKPVDLIQSNPGYIGLVPQQINFKKGTVRENLAFSYQAEDFSDAEYEECIQASQLSTFVSKLKNGLDTEITEFGGNLSGGEKQRFGIARALITRPKLLILDEATSALDGQTEAEITLSLQRLRGSLTVVVVAHRLSTIQDADVVAYMSNGSIIAKGSFDHVRETVPDFDHQAKLIGL
jgi:ABC-type multidrug transport system fused ATPase/permease subunit